jgi:Right handed beta helix region
MVRIVNRWIGPRLGASFAQPLRLLFLEGRVAPAIYTVTALGDANTGTGNAGDIRYCLGNAGNGDVINFDATLFASPQTINVNSQLVVANNVTISGPGFNGAGVALATLKNIAAASATSRLLEINLGLTASISGLAITGGNLPATYRGAGVESLASSLTLTNCVITGNSTAEDGGGISVSQDFSRLALISCTVSGNVATGATSDGGGIYLAAYSILTAKNSTIASNSTAHNGGGIYFDYGGSYTIENCTISGNSTAGKGGAVYFYGTAAPAPAIRNSTVSGNTAGIGGGLYFNGFSGGVTASSSIIAKNIGTPADIRGAVAIAGDNNLIFDTSGGFTLSGTGNVTGLDPMLDVLANNGGVTQTRALKAGSPALDAGNNVGGMGFDQRGSGFPRVQGAKADIGAYEAPSSIPNASLLALGSVIAAGTTPNTVQVTYSDGNAISFSTIDIGDIEIVAPDSSKLTITSAKVDASLDGSPRVATYTFALPGGSWDAADDGVYQVNVLANQVSNTDPAPQFVPAGSLGTFKVLIPAIYTVDATTDVDDGNYSAGHLSFREALKLANTTLGTSDTIAFDPAVFTSATTITMTGGQFSILDPVTINGPGANQLTIDANNLSRHFNIDVAGSSGNAVSISDLTLTRGNSVGANGGSIYDNDEILTLSNVILTKNTCTLSGGAIALAKTEAGLAISDCSIKQNSSTAPASTVNGGGALFVLGHSSVSIIRSTFSGNTSTNAAGGVYLFNGGTVLIQETTLSDNSAAGNGGAITVWSSTLTVINSTIAGNTATLGGGIRINSIANLTLNNCTVATNSASGWGGGISVGGSIAIVSLSSTIVATNVCAVAADISTPGSFAIGGGNNLIGVADQGGFTLTGSNKTGMQSNPLDPLLATLGAYGGPTLTMGLLSGSPAIDVGTDNGYSFDQRGTGFARKIGASADVGAFEGVVVNPVAKMNAFGPVITAGPTPNSLTVTYLDNTGINVSTVGLSNLTVLDPAANKLTITGASASPNSNGTPRTVTYTFTPPGGFWDVSDNGTYTVQMNANEVFDTDSTPLGVPAGTLGTFLVAVPNTYLVDEATDIDDGNTTTGHLSLREAIRLANTTNLGVADLVTFDANVFEAGTRVTLGGNELLITDPITIQGPGTGNLTLDGNSLSRIFNINLTNKGNAVAITGMTMTNGQVTDTNGGAIFDNNAVLTLSQVVVTGNKAVSNAAAAKGGGIALSDPAASLILIDSTVSNNKVAGTTAQGGGIYLFDNSAVTIQRSTISGNQAGEDGGGIYFNNGGFLTLADSTVSGNKANAEVAGAGGGGIYLFGTTATIRNSTISGNNTDSAGFASNGGGIAVMSSSSLVIQNNTVAFNSAIGASGGGLFLTPGTAVSSVSTIVANNTATLGADVAGQLVANFSLIGNTAGSTLLTGSASNILSVDPLLESLADNGGPTQTHALKSGSPAVGGGSNPAVLSYDQRGVGFARQVGTGVDIGAIEQLPAKVAGVVINGGAIQRSRVITVTVSFDQHVALPAAPVAAFLLKRQSDNATVTLGASVDDTGSGTVVTLSFTGGAVDGQSLADGRYTLTVSANLVSNANGGLDGDGNGVAQGSPADDYVLASAPSPNPPSNIYRIFGDVNGDGVIAVSDFIQFRSSFGSTNPVFDFNENTSIDVADFIQFRQRFGASI